MNVTWAWDNFDLTFKLAITRLISMLSRYVSICRQKLIPAKVIHKPSKKYDHRETYHIKINLSYAASIYI